MSSNWLFGTQATYVAECYKKYKTAKQDSAYSNHTDSVILQDMHKAIRALSSSPQITGDVTEPLAKELSKPYLGKYSNLHKFIPYLINNMPSEQPVQIAVKDYLQHVQDFVWHDDANHNFRLPGAWTEAPECTQNTLKDLIADLYRQFLKVCTPPLLQFYE